MLKLGTSIKKQDSELFYFQVELVTVRNSPKFQKNSTGNLNHPASQQTKDLSYVKHKSQLESILTFVVNL